MIHTMSKMEVLVPTPPIGQASQNNIFVCNFLFSGPLRFSGILYWLIASKIQIHNPLYFQRTSDSHLFKVQYRIPLPDSGQSLGQPITGPQLDRIVGDMTPPAEAEQSAPLHGITHCY
jgi:hypothetical protein